MVRIRTLFLRLWLWLFPPVCLACNGAGFRWIGRRVERCEDCRGRGVLR